MKRLLWLLFLLPSLAFSGTGRVVITIADTAATAKGIKDSLYAELLVVHGSSIGGQATYHIDSLSAYLSMGNTGAGADATVYYQYAIYDYDLPFKDSSALATTTMAFGESFSPAYYKKVMINRASVTYDSGYWYNLFVGGDSLGSGAACYIRTYVTSGAPYGSEISYFRCAQTSSSGSIPYPADEPTMLASAGDGLRIKAHLSYTTPNAAARRRRTLGYCEPDDLDTVRVTLDLSDPKYQAEIAQLMMKKEK